MAAQTFRDLTVYKKAFDLAMENFQVSKKFPSEEKYSLTDQVRRSLRTQELKNNNSHLSIERLSTVNFNNIKQQKHERIHSCWIQNSSR
jgi:23S rRNA-intervening sequence protein